MAKNKQLYKFPSLYGPNGELSELAKTGISNHPISQCPEFNDLYANKSNAFNKLAVQLEVHGIDIKLLRDLEDSIWALEQLARIRIYKNGFDHGIASGLGRMAMELERKHNAG